VAFLRPGARAALCRWRETLVGLGIVALGLWIGIDGFGLVLWFGCAVAVLGGVLAWAGVQRARFRTGQGGAGVVQLDERQITYFGPAQGGIVALDALARIELARDAAGSACWQLFEPGRLPLRIPVNAEGSEALFDAFAALDGLDVEKMLSTLRAPPFHPVVIWRRPGLRLH